MKTLTPSSWCFVAAGLLSLLALLRPAQAADEEPSPDTAAAEHPDDPAIVKLDPYTVSVEPPKLSFGIALQVWSDGHTGKVASIYITKVRANSHAEELGLRPRTRIDRINGIPVEELVASFNNDTVLNKTFVNRKLGHRVKLEVVVEGSIKSETVTVIEKPTIVINFPKITRGM